MQEFNIFRGESIFTGREGEMFKMFVQRLTGRFKGEIKNFPGYVRKPYNELGGHAREQQRRVPKDFFCFPEPERRMEVISDKKKTRKE